VHKQQQQCNHTILTWMDWRIKVQ